MSHELRTPLNSVLGFGQLLQLDPGLGEQRREHVDQIVRGGRHLLELINEVLDISRIESGTLSLSPEPVDVGEAVREAVALVRPLAEERAIAVRVDGDATATCSPTTSGSSRCCSTCSRTRSSTTATAATSPSRPSARTGTCALEVADTGPGVPPDRLERLFEPFDRLGAEHKRDRGHGARAGALALPGRGDGRHADRGEPRRSRAPSFAVALPAAAAPEAPPSPRRRRAGGRRRRRAACSTSRTTRRTSGSCRSC